MTLNDSNYIDVARQDLSDWLETYIDEKDLDKPQLGKICILLLESANCILQTKTDYSQHERISCLTHLLHVIISEDKDYGFFQKNDSEEDEETEDV